MPLDIVDLEFSYPGTATPLFSEVSLHIGEGWTGVVGANGCGKTTFLKVIAGILKPVSGHIRRDGNVFYVEQRTDTPPPEWEEFAYAYDGIAEKLRRTLGIQDDWADRWDTLSHGERKRIHIGVALWLAPDVLALDEPTNHIDEPTRALLLSALASFQGTGLVVSHDRDFMDALCRQCLFIDPPNAVVRPGGVSQGLAEQRKERTSAREEDAAAKRTVSRLSAAAQDRRELGDQVAAKNKHKKERKLPVHDHDGRAQRNLAKLTNKDAWAATQSSALAKRAGKVAKERSDIKVHKEYDMGFWLEENSRTGEPFSRRNAIVDIPAGTLPLGDSRTLAYPALTIRPTDRIALTGANGTGKSTLIRFILRHVNLPPERIISVPQEITAEESADIIRQVTALNEDERGRVMTSVSRLGSRPARLLESELPSPGETRKLLLALGVDRGPHFIVMDEPTNHLDLPSIECLEDALASCPCALLLVSHDRRFLSRLASREWAIAQNSLLTLSPSFGKFTPL